MELKRIVDDREVGLVEWGRVFPGRAACSVKTGGGWR